MALDSVQEITIQLKPLPLDSEALSREASFRDAGVAFVPVTHFRQIDEQGNDINSWCYAACAQMVFDFYKKNVRQCDIAGFAKDENCCPPTLLVCTEEGCDHEDIARIYDHWGIASTPHLQPAGHISLDDLRKELNEGRPVEVVIEWTSNPGSFHAIVIIGFSDPLGKVMYHDPAASSSGDLLDFDELTNSLEFKWDSTWTGLKRK
jgi:hypothetical protein